MGAMKIATHGSNGKGRGAGEIMKKWFFLDGINMFGNDCSVNQGDKGTVLVLPDPAQSPMSRGNDASVGAQLATDLQVFS
jgi:hypothetical protein